MRRGTSLHADQARRQSFEKRNHLAAPQSLSHNHLLLGVDPVDLKHVLGDIQTDRGNLHLDGSPHVIRLRRSLYGTSMPGAGAVHHIKSRLPRCKQKKIRRLIVNAFRSRFDSIQWPNSKSRTIFAPRVRGIVGKAQPVLKPLISGEDLRFIIDSQSVKSAEKGGQH
jgi:hypothetical protein